MKKLNNHKKRPDGAGAVVPASSTSKPASASSTRNPAEDPLLAILERNMLRATEPELVQRLRAAIHAIMEARRYG